MAFAFLFALWVWALAPTLHWLDTSELAAAAATFGIGHPPGQVVHPLLTSVFQMIPFGDASTRGALFSVACSLLTASIGYSLVSRFYMAKKGWKFYVLPLALSTAVSNQAVRTEVYALSSLLLVGAIALSLNEQDARKHHMAAFLWGLSLLNHPLIGLIGLPFFVTRRMISWVPTMMLAGILILYLPLRAASDTPWNFGNPDRWERFLWYIRGDLYKAYEAASVREVMANGLEIMKMALDALSPIGGALAVFGGVKLWKENRKLFWKLGAAFALCILPLARMSNFWSSNPDVGGYLLPGIWILWSLSLLGFLSLAKRRFRLPVAGLIVVVLVGFRIYGFVHESDYRRDFSARRQMIELLKEPVSGAKVEVASFSTYGLMNYGQQVEGLRPDLSIHYRGLRSGYQRASPSSDRGDSYWEPAINRDMAGKYLLREEDQERATSMVPEGWFYRIKGQKDPNWLERYLERLERVSGEIPLPFTYAKEPLILNALLHRMHCDFVGPPRECAKIDESIKKIFPELEDM